MSGSSLTEQLMDMHVHADFIAGADTAACVCTTVSPARFLSAQGKHEHLALGLHPWWLADGACGMEDVEELVRLIPEKALIGEIGLDFYGDYAATAELQKQAFRRICAALADGQRRFVSLHVRKAERLMLDILEGHGLPGASICCLHNFSGSSDDLNRAIALDCWFSASARTLGTKKWREYAKVIPVERLLLETDFPPARILPRPEDTMAAAGPIAPERKLTITSEEWASALEDALKRLETLKGCPLRAQIIENQAQILGV